MKKLILTLAAVVSTSFAIGAKDAVLMIDAQKNAAVLEAVSATPGGTFVNASHFKGRDSAKNKQMLFAYYSVQKKWREKEIVFKADRDCSISISLSVSAGTVLFDNVRMTGAALANGDFEKDDEGWKMIDFKNQDGPPEIVEEKGIKNTKALELTSKAQTARQFLKLKGGTPVKIIYSFKEL